MQSNQELYERATEIEQVKNKLRVPTLRKGGIREALGLRDLLVGNLPM